MSDLAIMAQAVVDLLKAAPAGTFPASFTPERAWVPEKKVTDMVDGQVYVLAVPRTIEDEPAGRSAEQLDIQIDLAVQMKLPAAGRTESADGAADLVQSLRSYLLRKRLTPSGQSWSGVCVKASYGDACSAELWRDRGVFSSILKLTLRTVR